MMSGKIRSLPTKRCFINEYTRIFAEILKLVQLNWS